MNMRKITSMTMIWSLIVLTFNSVVLYVVPEGRVANWADWRFWGLDKGDWSAQHTTVGVLFIVAGLLHIYYNWRPIVSYLKNRAKRLTLFTGASTVGLGLTLVFVVGTYLEVPPLSTIVDLSAQIKEGAARKYGDPPYGQAQSSSLQGFTSRLGLDLGDSVARLAAAGITVADTQETVVAIAERSGLTPQQLYDLVKRADPRSGGADSAGPGGEVSTGTVAQPPSGMGKKTIDQLCDEMGQDCTMVVQGLKKRGMVAEPGQKVKDLAEANGMGPMQFYEMMEEIVNEPQSR